MNADRTRGVLTLVLCNPRQTLSKYYKVKRPLLQQTIAVPTTQYLSQQRRASETFHHPRQLEDSLERGSVSRSRTFLLMGDV